MESTEKPSSKISLSEGLIFSNGKLLDHLDSPYFFETHNHGNFKRGGGGVQIKKLRTECNLHSGLCCNFKRDQTQ